MQLFTKELAPELKARWERLQKGIQREEADGLLVSDNVNLYYVSGRVFSGFCYLPAQGDPLFFVRRPEGLSDPYVHYIRKPEDIPSLLTKQGIECPTTILLECDSASYNDCLRYQKALGSKEIKNGTALLRSVRTLKSAYEIELLRRSGALHTEAYKRIPDLYRPGMSDVELSAAIEHECRRLGSLGLFRIFGQSMEIYMGSVLAGENADTPSPYDFAMGGAGLDHSLPGGANGTQLQEGMSVMVDLGGNFTGYMTDMTRTFAVGKLSDTAVRAHQLSREIQQAIEQIARPGTPAKELYDLAAHMADEAGYKDFFMGHRQQAGFVGHGIGIEINEAPVLAPRSRDVLAEGMVFALEPKFVIPGTGAVGVENTFVVHATGLEKLTLCDESLLSLSM